MMKFINWFKGSLEDAAGTASFRRIYNWILISLISFLVIYHALKHNLTQTIIYEILLLLIAGFLNIGVVTIDNILRFFNRNKGDQPDPPAEQKATITGDVTIKPEQP